jgi:hypothetical protein
MPQIISQLIKPARSLVVRFDTSGSLAVTHLVRQGTKYATVETSSLAPIKPDTPFPFEFSVDPTASNAPQSLDAGLFVDAYGDWDVPGWEEEYAMVMGGSLFPFGNDAMQISGNFNGAVAVSRVVGGNFTKPANGPAVVTLQGTTRTIIQTLPATLPGKYMSLWLPDGVHGQLKFPNWPGSPGGRIFRSEEPPKPAPKKGAKKK